MLPFSVFLLPIPFITDLQMLNVNTKMSYYLLKMHFKQADKLPGFGVRAFFPQVYLCHSVTHLHNVHLAAILGRL